MRTNAKLEINLNYLKNNFKLIQTRAPKAQVLFMVKADAYGHGAAQIATFCFHECKIKHFGLATLGEAIELKENLPDREVKAYAFSENGMDQFEQNKAHYLEKEIIPVLFQMKDLKTFLNDKDMTRSPLVIKVNIGMNRLGIDFDELSEMISVLLRNGRRKIDHLMAHFPGSNDPTQIEETKSQYQRFLNIKSLLISQGIEVVESSVSNSGAIEREIGICESFIRPGLLAYGAYTCSDNPMGWKGRVISKFIIKPIMLREVKKGDGLGYGSPEASTDGILAIVPAGYADGLSSGYEKLEYRCGDFIGVMASRVNMDMSLILFSLEAKDALSQEEIMVWGESSWDLLQLAKKVGLLPYHLFCQISSRVPRVYKIGYN